MSSIPHQYGQQPPQDTLSSIISRLRTYWSNLTTQTHSAFQRMEPKDYIRLVVIMCAYALIIRPLLLKLGAKYQQQQHDRDEKEGKLGPNDLREKIAIPGVDSDTESDEEEGKADTVKGEWGRKARVRQRRVVRRALEVKEQLGLEDDDEDIKEFLRD
jgi:hypothetical protein